MRDKLQDLTEELRQLEEKRSKAAADGDDVSDIDYDIDNVKREIRELETEEELEAQYSVANEDEISHEVSEEEVMMAWRRYEQAKKKWLRSGDPTCKPEIVKRLEDRWFRLSEARRRQSRQKPKHSGRLPRFHLPMPKKIYIPHSSVPRGRGHKPITIARGWTTQTNSYWVNPPRSTYSAGGGNTTIWHEPQRISPQSQRYREPVTPQDEQNDSPHEREKIIQRISENPELRELWERFVEAHELKLEEWSPDALDQALIQFLNTLSEAELRELALRAASEMDAWEPGQLDVISADRSVRHAAAAQTPESADPSGDLNPTLARPPVDGQALSGQIPLDATGLGDSLFPDPLLDPVRDPIGLDSHLFPNPWDPLADPLAQPGQSLNPYGPPSPEDVDPLPGPGV